MSQGSKLNLPDIAGGLVHLVVLQHGRVLVEGVARHRRDMLNGHALGVEFGCKGMAEGM